MKAKTRSLGIMCLLVFLPNPSPAERAPAGTCCQYWSDANRDAAGHFDSCLITKTEAACASPQWCVIIGAANGWYCVNGPAPCPTESVCDGTPVTVNVQDGACEWGYGNINNPRPNGECFCLYNPQLDPVPITFYACSP